MGTYIMSSASVVSVGPTAASSSANTGIRGIQGVPDGFPEQLNSPLAWIGANITEEDYIYYLTEYDKADIERAIEYFLSKSISCFLFF